MRALVLIGILAACGGVANRRTVAGEGDTRKPKLDPIKPAARKEFENAMRAARIAVARQWGLRRRGLGVARHGSSLGREREDLHRARSDLHRAETARARTARARKGSRDRRERSGGVERARDPRAASR